jgi:uncharacterized protein (DUF1778 family)
MPTTKMTPCCARVAARVTMEEANLARLARRAAARDSAGLSTLVLREKIAIAKESVAQAKQVVIDHDADHAAGGL